MIDLVADLDVGTPIPPVRYEVTWEKIALYSRHVFGGKDTRNIHTDDAIARRAGLPRAVAQGRYPIGYIAERMVDLFGAHWFQGGQLDVKLARPIYPGDVVTVQCEVTNRIVREDGVSITLAVWLENQAGERPTVGRATCFIARGLSSYAAAQ